jgi:hypothetical protein
LSGRKALQSAVKPPLGICDVCALHEQSAPAAKQQKKFKNTTIFG